ncbi:dihydrodipicolinate reductase [Mycobacterium sp. 236(2023)]|uniref:dihydrodipicolinate reductase n=1 Tax=Mycobacterium sp. 236(2023) TaxID=3038163 RepID=UPI00241577C2|nr:dihydrodipicolinate reductase [Mycobacterium sp. 236(2023)]MDG4669423.1 dihydrodipicolinate reductase [Mycobacterium sp. 236(2023)]
MTRSSEGTHAPRRVAHVGTGMTGSVALRAIIDDPALDLVGLKVTSESKVGTDAGQLCGRPATGIAATEDVAAVLAAQPDCVAYCATAVRREDEVIADIVGYLRAGINVVTISAIPMVYPSAAPTKWREPIEKAAISGGSTFYATGCEPGFVSLNLPTALLAGAGAVHAYRMDEYALDLDLSYPIWEVLHESMGFGKPDGHVPVRIAVGKVSDDWEPVVRYIADVLRVTIDNVALEWETVLAPHDLDTALGVIAKNTICGHRWQLAAIHDERPVASVQYFATVTSTPWPENWPRPAQPGQGGMVFRIEGNPNMTLDLRLDPSPDDATNPGVTATAMAAVNAIPAVIDAPPGLLPEPLAGPSIVTRQTRRRDALFDNR